MLRSRKLLDLLKPLESFFDRDPWDDDEDDEIAFHEDALHVFELGRAIPDRAELLEELFKRGPIRNLVPLIAIGTDDDDAGCALARAIGDAVIEHGAKQRPNIELVTTLSTYLKMLAAPKMSEKERERLRATIAADLDAAAQSEDSEVLGDDFDDEFGDHPAPAVIRNAFRLLDARDLPLAVWALQKLVESLDGWLDMHHEHAVIAHELQTRVFSRKIVALPARAEISREIQEDELAPSTTPAFVGVHPERVAPEDHRGAVLQLASELQGHGVRFRFDDEELPLPEEHVDEGAEAEEP